MGQFDTIRPYNDSEVTAVLERLLNDKDFLDILTHFRFSRFSGALAWLLKPMIALKLRREFAGITTVAMLQEKVEYYVDHTIEQATDGVTYTGVEQLKSSIAYLFLANHRDIVMDPTFVNYALYHAGLPTPRIAIGDNLLQKKFVSDLMRLNKSFIVHRSITGRKEKMAAYHLLSSYINHSIRNDCQSIWIAQAEGRAKDGDDRTESALLKMFQVSRRDEPFFEVIQSLNLTPVSISYEYDPCDLAKARELYIRATTGTYNKAPGEDDVSIALGITGNKGRVHVNFSTPITERFEDTKMLALEIDRQIIGGYRLFPVHYLAYEQWSDAEPKLHVPKASEVFPPDELAKAKEKWELRLNDCPAEHQPFLVVQYSMPVRNQYCVKSGVAL